MPDNQYVLPVVKVYCSLKLCSIALSCLQHLYFPESPACSLDLKETLSKVCDTSMAMTSNQRQCHNGIDIVMVVVLVAVVKMMVVVVVVVM